ncbi:MAG: hypothetical protein A2808_03560 [Candidatus Moranbacteria bacterium RIFCSPHIGHO2_01_FULL_55_24]|nr:MAG: hypothetical protein A2808_03560 [Candidatus Moranbacteria bacterium RIFCSPHIGHO2_01_FULL_55_24]
MTFFVPRKYVDKRLDLALASLLQGHPDMPEGARFSRSELKKLILSGDILLNGKRANPETKLFYKDKITVSEAIWNSEAVEKRTLGARRYTLGVLEENKDFLVLNKESGISVHPKAGRKSSDFSLIEAILFRYPEIKDVGEDEERPGIVHRLDRETSGVLVVARTEKAFQALKQAFQERQAEKTYLALVYGKMPQEAGIIDLPLTRKKGTLKRRIARARDGEDPQRREAVTEYRVLAHFPGSGASLVEFSPKTGRMHQIRVHAAALGNPVLGDKLYASKASRAAFPDIPRHMLHAESLSFPLFGQKYVFSAPLPEDFRGLLEDIDETGGFRYDNGALKSLSS